jgi:hypothetical protein
LSPATTKTILAAGTAVGLAYATWTVCAPVEPGPAPNPGSVSENAALPPDTRPELREPEDTASNRAEDAEPRPPDGTQRIGKAAQASPSELDKARARLERITTRMREARDDPSSLTNEQRQALFAEGMAAYDTMRAQASLAGPEAKAELAALYPEFRELMLAVKPPPPQAPQADADGG